jgi:hypothetical protein
MDKCKESQCDARIIRKIDSYSIMEFKDKLSEELWQNLLDNTNTDVDSNFNSFLNRYLQIFYSCFPEIKVYERRSINQWITKSIINSCKKEMDLHLLTRSTNDDEKLKNYYLKYSYNFIKNNKSY